MALSVIDNGKTVVRVVLGSLLLWAAVSKTANPTEFLAAIYAYQLPLPRTLLQLVAMILPWTELICGFLLLMEKWTESALVCICALMLVFLIATGQAWVRGLTISCGCFDLRIFGVQQSESALIKFVESVGFAFFRNLVLTAMAFFLLNRASRAT
ncbi:MAG: hypothetical protein FJ403_12250 [Verrucomicrobia bacterium]|nr:hypothetical protein [Verrucomicrobiota bacterium]